MRRLLPLFALLLLAALAFWVFQQPNANPTHKNLNTPDSALQVQAAALDFNPNRQETSQPEVYEPRVEKAGAGSHQLQGTVVDEKGNPLPDMWVAAFPSPYPLFDFETSFAEILEKPLQLKLEPIASVRSDEDGHFSLQGLFGRSTYLVARGHYHLTRGRQEVRPTDLDTDGGYVLYTVPGASLQGTVVDEHGAPMVNAEVFVGPSWMYIIQAVRSGNLYLERIFTDGAGRFSLDVVPANQKLTILAMDGATHPGLQEVGPLRAHTDATTTVHLAATGEFHGSVVTKDEQPVRGAKVLAVPIDLRLVASVARSLADYTVTTDSQGEFHFSRLPQRKVLLFAQSSQGRSVPIVDEVRGTSTTAKADLILQSVLDLSGKVVDLRGRGLANAKIYLNSLPSGKGDETETETFDLAKMALSLAGEALSQFLPKDAWVLSDAQGNFSIPAWRGATVKVEVEGYAEAQFTIPKEGEKSFYVLVMMKPGKIHGTVVEDASNQEIPYFIVNASLNSSFLKPEVSLEKKENESSKEFRQRKREQEDLLRKERLGILAGKDNLLFPTNSKISDLRTVQFCDHVKNFDIPNLMPGTWNVEVRAEGYVLAGQQNIEVLPGKTNAEVAVRLQRGASVSGRVEAFGSREPIAGAVVTAGFEQNSGFQAYLRMGVETTAMARTDADGSFTLVGLEPGMEWLHVLAEGFAPTSMHQEALQEGEQRTDVVIQVHTGASIHGHVLDRHGSPIPSRLVGGYASDSQDFWQAATNEEGYYQADHIKPGNYFILTAALDDDNLFRGNMMSVLNGSRIVQAYVKDGQVLELDITDFSAGGCKLRGQLLSSGQPVPHAQLFAMATDTGGLFDFRMATASTDEKGEFLFKSLAPGDYRLQIQSEVWTGSMEFEAPDLEEDYQILETPSGVVRGRVLAEHTGNPVAKASVKLIHDNSGGGLFAMFGSGKETDWGTTDKDGYYEFTGKAEGRYHIEVELSSWRLPDSQMQQEALGRAKSKGFTLYENDTKLVEDLRLPISSALLLAVKTSDGKAPDGGYSVVATLEEATEGTEPLQTWGFGDSTLLSGLTAGVYRVRIEGRGFATTTLEHVVVGEAETVNLNITVEKGVALSARILDGNSQSIPDAQIKVFDREGRRVDGLDGIGGNFARMFSGENGAMPLGTFVPGSYRVEVEYQGQVQTRNASLRANQPVVLEFQFP